MALQDGAVLSNISIYFWYHMTGELKSEAWKVMVTITFEKYTYTGYCTISGNISD